MRDHCTNAYYIYTAVDISNNRARRHTNSENPYEINKTKLYKEKYLLSNRNGKVMAAAFISGKQIIDLA